MLLPRGGIVPHKHRKVPNLKIQSMASPACLSVFFLWCHKLSKTSCTCQVRTPPSYILSPFLYFFPCILQDRAPLCSCGYSGTQFVDKDNLKMTLRLKKKKDWFTSMCACLPVCVCTVLLKARRGYWVLSNWMQTAVSFDVATRNQIQFLCERSTLYIILKLDS